MAEEKVSQQVRGHIIAFAVVLLLAIVAGGTTILGLASTEAVLAIAAVQVIVVMGFMMHVQRDGNIVGGTMILCGVFIVAMAGLMVLGLNDEIDGTERILVESADEPGPAASQGSDAETQ